MTTKTIDEIVRLFAPSSDANTILGTEIIGQINSKFSGEDLGRIFDDISGSHANLLQADVVLDDLIGRLPNGANTSNFQNLMKELKRLQIYVFLTNCNQVKKDLDQARQDHQQAIQFIDDLVDALNVKLGILNPITYAQIGGNNYFNKYMKYKTKYLNLKNQIYNEYYNFKGSRSNNLR